MNIKFGQIDECINMNDNNFINDKKVIKASFKDCPIKDRDLFSSSSCLLTISVGNSNHEGEKFNATINLVNKSFKSCTIMVGDVLQRHNISVTVPNVNEQKAYDMALSRGTMWVERNKKIYEQLTIPYNIIRWNKWLAHHNFKDRLIKVDQLYQNNIDYSSSIDASIQDYLQRSLTNREFNKT